jgi:DinB family protein
MTETAEEYKSRFAAYVEGKDPIAMQREAPDTIADLIAGVAPARLKRPPAPGKWSVLQIIAHLAEDELASSWRYRQMLEHDGPELSAFDQDLWARVGDYSSWQHEDALTMFRLLRQANLRMFARLSPQQWQRCGTHTERGKVTIRELCRHMAAHDVNHIEQIKGILNSRTAYKL